MAGSSFGQSFRVTTAGESHGPANVVIIDGCPPGLALCEDDLLPDLERRRPGQSRLTTQRKETDQPEILSGVYEGRTTGTPIAIAIRNEDQRSRDYSEVAEKYRPGHADYTYDAKYGFRDPRGGGRASARETAVRVAAGAVARKLLAERFGIEVLGCVVQVGAVVAPPRDPMRLTRTEVEFRPDGEPNPSRCADPATALLMEAEIDAARRDLDSLGGVAMVVARGVPAGWGEPVFDRLKADLAKAIFSIPAVTGVEFGLGFGAAALRGSQHNDPFRMADGHVVTVSNRHGGILGGISSGQPIVLRAAVKPTSSLAQEQLTVTRDGQETTLSTKGRHDPCLLPRFVPVAEAMVLLTLADHWLRQRGQVGP